MRPNWFNRQTGSNVRRYPDCECRSYNRPYCFSCVIFPEYSERSAREDSAPREPRWWGKYMSTQLNNFDYQFLRRG